MLLLADYSTSIVFRRLDDKRRPSGQHQQILVAGNENIGYSAVRQVQQSLILWVAAADGAALSGNNALAEGKIIGKQLNLLLTGDVEPGIGEDSSQFVCCVP